MKFQVKKKLRSKDSFIRNHRNLPNAQAKRIISLIEESQN